MPHEPTLSAQISRNLVDFAVQRGADRPALLSAVGLAEEILHNTEARLPVRTHIALFDAAVELSGDPALALHLGESHRTGMLHVVGYAAMNSPTLGAALERLERFWNLLAEGTRFEARRTGSDVALVMHVTDPHLPAPNRGFETVLTSRVAFGRFMTGQDFAPKLVCFPFSDPGYPEEYARVFRCPVRFNQPEASVTLPASLLELPLVGANPQMCALFDQLAEDAMRAFRGEDALISQLRAMLRQTLREQAPNLQAAARKLGLGARTLQRRLQGLGQSYAEVLDSTRRELCLEYLADPRVGIEEAAFLAGYEEPRSFLRAVRRWTGLSPSAYRRQQQKQDSQPG